MKEVNGGGCSNAHNVINGLGLSTVVVSSLLVATTGGLALFAIGAAVSYTLLVDV